MFNAQDIILARQFKPDLSISKLDTESLILLKIMNHARGGGVVPVYDADITNGIASFDGVTRSKPLVSLKLNIPITQQGSGTPSPDNIRDFIPVSGVNIGQTSGYGKYFRGLLNGTYGFVDLGTLNWNEVSLAEGFGARATFEPRKFGYDVVSICDSYEFFGSAITTSIRNNIQNGQFAYQATNSYIWIRDDRFSDVESLIASLSGKYLIYELAEPSTPVTPEQFATLCQAFGITGNISPITFGQTVYSAILDVLNGKLILPENIKTIDENSDITMSTTGTGIFYLDDFFEIDEDTGSINSNVYQRAENRSSVTEVINNNPDYSFCCKLGTNPTRVMIKDTRFTSTEDYNTWLSTNPVKIAVKLATPIEIQLTPTVINTLIGENVIFADVANVTECKYTRK